MTLPSILRRGTLASLTGIAMLGVTACAGSAISGDEEKSSDGPIKLGLSTALSGAYSEYGVPMQDSINLAIEEYNANGGVNGRKIELIAYDDQLVAETAQSNVRRLLDEDQVDFVLAPAGSGPTTAILPLVKAKNTLLMNSIAQAPEIVYPEGADAAPNENVFGFALPNDVEAQAMAEHLSANYGSVALIAESTPYGESGADSVTEQLQKLGSVDVVASETYEQQATDVTAQMARIRKENPDAIAMIGLGNDTATIRQAMARLGMIGTDFLISNGAGTLPYQERAKELVEGTLVINYSAYPGTEPETDSAKNFAEAYKAAYGNDEYYGPNEWPVPAFGGTPASSYDAVKILLEAIEAADSTDYDDVISTLESGDTFTGSRGDYTFSPDQHNGVTVDQLAVNRYVVEPDGTVTFERADG